MSQENWRWFTGKHLRPTSATVAVIEPPDKEPEERPSGIPFGFARAVEGGSRAPGEPLTWEGDQA